MKRLFLLVFWLAIPLGANARPAGSEGAAPTSPIKSGGFPYPIKVEVLPNGLTVARVKFPSPGLTAYDTVMRVGSRNEIEPGHSGFAHFFEHMMFKGTARYPTGSREARVVSRYGLHDNATTSSDFTFFETFGPSEALPALIDAEADRFQNLAYAEPSFQTEASAVLGEYNKDISEPEAQLNETLVGTAFTKHTYRHTTLGFKADILRMPTEYAYSQGFFKRHYRPDNAIILIVGDFDDDAVMKLIREKYAPWKRGAEKTSIPVEPPQTSERHAALTWPTPVLPRLWMGWHIPGASLKTNVDAVGTVLGSYLAGPTSPLYKTLVLEKQWAESLYADGSSSRDPSLFALVATVKDPAHVADVQAAVDAALRDVSAGMLDAQRIQDIKSAVHYGVLTHLETAPDVINSLIQPAALFGDPRAIDHTLRAIGQVTPEELVAYAKKYLLAKNRTVVTLQSKTAAEASR